MKRIFFLVVSLTLVLVLMDAREYWLPAKNTPAAAIKQDVIDYYFSDFNLQAFTPQGQQHYQVTGNHLKHWQAQQTSSIIAPTIKSFAPDGQLNAAIQADEAILHHKSDQIELNEHVMISHTGQAGEPMTLTTDQLNANLNTKLITTDRHVLIKTSNATLQGIGLESKLDEAYSRLHSHVQSVYQSKF